MRKSYKFHPLKIVERYGFFDYIICLIARLYGFILCYLSNLKYLTITGLPVSKNVFRMESICVEENGYKVYRRPWCKLKVEGSFKGMKTVTEIIQNLVKTAPDREVIGVRPVLREYKLQEGNRSRIVKDLGPYQWVTSSQVYDRILKIAAYFSSLGIKKGDNIVLFAETSLDYFIITQATNLLRATYATMYPNLPNDYIANCIELVEPKLIFIDRKCYKRIETMISNFPHIKNIFLATDCDRENVGILGDYIQCTKMSEIISGRPPSANFEKLLEEPQPEDVATIMFTSGSTGNAKGVIITQINIVSLIAGVIDQEWVMKEQVYAAYLPLSHILELCCEISALSYGGQVGYCHPSTLFDESPMLSPNSISDLRALNPTSLASVTMILERMKMKFLEFLKKAPRYKQIIFQELYNVKASFLGYGYKTPYLDDYFFKKFTGMFGNRFKYSLTGGAYLPPETEEFFNVVYGVFKQAYGATEVVGCGTISNYDYTRPGNVGPPFCCSEIRLIPWEEGGYDMKDEKCPTGELLISGTCITKGYYKNKKATDEVFEFDPVTGKTWYHTEDIGRVLEDGTFSIIGKISLS